MFFLFLVIICSSLSAIEQNAYDRYKNLFPSREPEDKIKIYASFAAHMQKASSKRDFPTQDLRAVLVAERAAARIVQQHPEAFAHFLTTPGSIDFNILLTSSDKITTRRLKGLVQYFLSDDSFHPLNNMLQMGSAQLAKSICSELYLHRESPIEAHFVKGDNPEDEDSNTVSCRFFLFPSLEKHTYELMQGCLRDISQGWAISPNISRFFKVIAHKRKFMNYDIPEEDLFTQGEGPTGGFIQNLTREQIVRCPHVPLLLTETICCLDERTATRNNEHMLLPRYKTVMNMINFLNHTFVTDTQELYNAFYSSNRRTTLYDLALHKLTMLGIDSKPTTRSFNEFLERMKSFELLIKNGTIVRKIENSTDYWENFVNGFSLKTVCTHIFPQILICQTVPKKKFLNAVLTCARQAHHEGKLTDTIKQAFRTGLYGSAGLFKNEWPHQTLREFCTKIGIH